MARLLRALDLKYIALKSAASFRDFHDCLINTRLQSAGLRMSDRPFNLVRS